MPASVFLPSLSCFPSGKSMSACWHPSVNYQGTDIVSWGSCLLVDTLLKISARHRRSKLGKSIIYGHKDESVMVGFLTARVRHKISYNKPGIPGTETPNTSITSGNEKVPTGTSVSQSWAVRFCPITSTTPHSFQCSILQYDLVMPLTLVTPPWPAPTPEVVVIWSCRRTVTPGGWMTRMSAFFGDDSRWFGDEVDGFWTTTTCCACTSPLPAKLVVACKYRALSVTTCPLFKRLSEVHVSAQGCQG